ncbi:MAG: hypothetical protein JWP32_2906 [Schumannella sp.]|nr:hypothetical protein [Schumannella sp.]
MPSFKNVAGFPVDMPALDIRVADGDVFDVNVETAAALAENPFFTAVDAPQAKPVKTPRRKPAAVVAAPESSTTADPATDQAAPATTEGSI